MNRRILRPARNQLTSTTEHGWIQTASGRAWSLTAPTPDAVHWRDIAESLAKICRFNGHSRYFYSVAQHSVIVADMLIPEYRLHGLLHDAHEAFIGDMTAPVKGVLKDLGGYEAIGHLAEITDRAVFAAAGLSFPWPTDIRTAVKWADMTMLATERRDLLADSAMPWGPLPDPAPARITPWAWPRAMDEWLTRLDRHLPHSNRRV